MRCVWIITAVVVTSCGSGAEVADESGPRAATSTIVPATSTDVAPGMTARADDLRQRALTTEQVGCVEASSTSRLIDTTERNPGVDEYGIHRMYDNRDDKNRPGIDLLIAVVDEDHFDQQVEESAELADQWRFGAATGAAGSVTWVVLDHLDEPPTAAQVENAVAECFAGAVPIDDE